MFEHALKNNNIKGKTNDEQNSLLIKSRFGACASFSKVHKNLPSQRLILKYLGILDPSYFRMWNKAKEKRHHLCGAIDKEGGILWAHVRHQKEYQNVLE